MIIHSLLPIDLADGRTSQRARVMAATMARSPASVTAWPWKSWDAAHVEMFLADGRYGIGRPSRADIQSRRSDSGAAWMAFGGKNQSSGR